MHVRSHHSGQPMYCVAAMAASTRAPPTGAVYFQGWFTAIAIALLGGGAIALHRRGNNRRPYATLDDTVDMFAPADATCKAAVRSVAHAAKRASDGEAEGLAADDILTTAVASSEHRWRLPRFASARSREHEHRNPQSEEGTAVLHTDSAAQAEAVSDGTAGPSHCSASTQHAPAEPERSTNARGAGLRTETRPVGTSAPQTDAAAAPKQSGMAGSDAVLESPPRVAAEGGVDEAQPADSRARPLAVSSSVTKLSQRSASTPRQRSLSLDADGAGLEMEAPPDGQSVTRRTDDTDVHQTLPDMASADAVPVLLPRVASDGGAEAAQPSGMHEHDSVPAPMPVPGWSEAFEVSNEPTAPPHVPDSSGDDAQPSGSERVRDVAAAAVASDAGAEAWQATDNAASEMLEQTAAEPVACNVGAAGVERAADSLHDAEGTLANLASAATGSFTNAAHGLGDAPLQDAAETRRGEAVPTLNLGKAASPQPPQSPSHSAATSYDMAAGVQQTLAAPDMSVGAPAARRFASGARAPSLPVASTPEATTPHEPEDEAPRLACVRRLSLGRLAAGLADAATPPPVGSNSTAAAAGPPGGLQPLAAVLQTVDSADEAARRGSAPSTPVKEASADAPPSPCGSTASPRGATAPATPEPRGDQIDLADASPAASTDADSPRAMVPFCALAEPAETATPLQSSPRGELHVAEPECSWTSLSHVHWDAEEPAEPEWRQGAQTTSGHERVQAVARSGPLLAEVSEVHTEGAAQEATGMSAASTEERRSSASHAEAAGRWEVQLNVGRADDHDAGGHVTLTIQPRVRSRERVEDLAESPVAALGSASVSAEQQGGWDGEPPAESSAAAASPDAARGVQPSASSSQPDKAALAVVSGRREASLELSPTSSALSDSVGNGERAPTAQDSDVSAEQEETESVACEAAEQLSAALGEDVSTAVGTEQPAAVDSQANVLAELVARAQNESTSAPLPGAAEESLRLTDRANSMGDAHPATPTQASTFSQMRSFWREHPGSPVRPMSDIAERSLSRHASGDSHAAAQSYLAATHSWRSSSSRGTPDAAHAAAQTAREAERPPWGIISERAASFESAASGAAGSPSTSAAVLSGARSAAASPLTTGFKSALSGMTDGVSDAQASPRALPAADPPEPASPAALPQPVFHHDVSQGSVPAQLPSMIAAGLPFPAPLVDAQPSAPAAARPPVSDLRLALSPRSMAPGPAPVGDTPRSQLPTPRSRSSAIGTRSSIDRSGSLIPRPPTAARRTNSIWTASSGMHTALSASVTSSLCLDDTTPRTPATRGSQRRAAACQPGGSLPDPKPDDDAASTGSSLSASPSYLSFPVIRGEEAGREELEHSAGI